MDCHKAGIAGVVTDVDAADAAFGQVKIGDERIDLETIFTAQYERIARVIAGVIRDRARAEELAVDVFLKWSRTPKAHGEKADGWLYRTAVRTGLNELRRENRRSRYESLFALFNAKRRSPTPEDIRAGTEEREHAKWPGEAGPGNDQFSGSPGARKMTITPLLTGCGNLAKRAGFL